MRPSSTRLTGISGSNTVFSCSQTLCSSKGPSTAAAAAAAGCCPSASASFPAMRNRPPSSVVTVNWPPNDCAISTRVPAGSTASAPLGILVASQSRASTIGPLPCGGVSMTCTTGRLPDRKSTRLNSSHLVISYAVFCLKKNKTKHSHDRYHAFEPALSPAHTKLFRAILTYTLGITTVPLTTLPTGCRLQLTHPAYSPTP